MKKREFLKSVGLGSVIFSLSPLELFSKSKQEIPQENEVEITVTSMYGQVVINNSSELIDMSEASVGRDNTICGVVMWKWIVIYSLRDMLVTEENPENFIFEYSESYLKNILEQNPDIGIIIRVNDKKFLVKFLLGSIWILNAEDIIEANCFDNKR